MSGIQDTALILEYFLQQREFFFLSMGTLSFVYNYLDRYWIKEQIARTDRKDVWALEQVSIV
jgi:hypothetical protein